MSSPKGYPSTQKLDRTKSEFSTVSPIGPTNTALDTRAFSSAINIGSDAAEAGSTESVIVATAHAALKGDIIRFTSGDLDDRTATVIDVATDSITLGEDLPSAIANGVTFEILRPRLIELTSSGDVPISGSISVTQGPTQFVLNTVDTEVEEDTGTPANSRPLPIKALDGSGAEVDFATEATLGNIETDIATIAAVDFATETTLSSINTALSDVATETTLGSMFSYTQDIETNTRPFEVKDLIDTTGFINASSANIPGNASAQLQLVASLAAEVRKLQFIDTTGALLGIYTGASSSEVLKFVVGPGSDSTIECLIPAGTRISVRRLDSASAATSGLLAINFLGII